MVARQVCGDSSLGERCCAAAQCVGLSFLRPRLIRKCLTGRVVLTGFFQVMGYKNGALFYAHGHRPTARRLCFFLTRRTLLFEAVSAVTEITDSVAFCKVGSCCRPSWAALSDARQLRPCPCLLFPLFCQAGNGPGGEVHGKPNAARSVLFVFLLGILF